VVIVHKFDCTLKTKFSTTPRIKNFSIYYINVKSPNLDLKLGIKPKAGNFLSGKREGEGGRETEIGR
jgi:hypothetical protein